MGQTIAIYFLLISAQNSLPPGLLSSLCYVESTHNPKAMHITDGHSNSVGICQIKLISARQMGYSGTEKDLLNPKTNIMYAGRYLAHQIKRYNGDVSKGVIAYNQGHAGNKVTSKYQGKVFAHWQGKKPATERFCAMPRKGSGAKIKTKPGWFITQMIWE